MTPATFSRRDALKTLSSGFGYLAFAALATRASGNIEASPLAPKGVDVAKEELPDMIILDMAPSPPYPTPFEAFPP